MMTDNKKKIIIASILLVVFIGLIVLFSIVSVNLGIINISSVKNLLSKHEEVKSAENLLASEQNTYESAKDKLASGKANYKREQTKYNAISDETVEIIKEATTEEKYSLEYMWIKLGNYAKRNNLSIILTEPGGTANVTENKDEKTNTATNNTATPTDGAKTGEDAANKSSTSTSTSTGNPSGTDTTNPGGSGSNTLFKIQVSGSYIDISDFIFEVENDKELRFKLDNISIEYVSGTTIKASFNVKNMIFIK